MRGRERGRWAWQGGEPVVWTVDNRHILRTCSQVVGGSAVCTPIPESPDRRSPIIHLRTCCIHNPFPFDIKGGSEGGKGSHHVCARRPHVMKGGWEEAKVGSGDGIATAAVLLRIEALLGSGHRDSHKGLFARLSTLSVASIGIGHI